MTCLIFGAGNTISKGAITFYRQQFKSVYICDLERRKAAADADVSGAEAIEENINAFDEASVYRLISRVDPAHILNLVGGGKFILTESLTWDELSASIELNLRPVHTISQAFHRHLLRDGKQGTVVHVSSANVVRPIKGYVAYVSAKGSLEAYIRASAIEYAPQLRIYAIQPGPMETTGESIAAVLKRQCAPFHLMEKRLTQGEDVARIAWALHASFAWSTGISVLADGGLLLASGP